MRRKVVLASVVVIATLAMTGTAWLHYAPAQGGHVDSATTGHSSGGDAAATASYSFALTDQNGKRVTDQDLRGKPTIIYFGYAYCPDVCPTSLLLMQTAVDQLGPQARAAAPADGVSG